MLLAVEGATIPWIQPLLTVHIFVGMLLLGPVALKFGATGYRFLRYYGGSPEYVEKGPPAPLMRVVVAPILVLSTLTLFGTGVGLLVFGRGVGMLSLLHKASFIVWFGATAIHVLVYAAPSGQIRARRASSPTDRRYRCAHRVTHRIHHRRSRDRLRDASAGPFVDPLQASATTIATTADPAVCCTSWTDKMSTPLTPVDRRDPTSPRAAAQEARGGSVGSRSRSPSIVAAPIILVPGGAKHAAGSPREADDDGASAKPPARVVRLVRRTILVEHAAGSLPAPLQDPSSAVVGGKALLFGGLTAADTSTDQIVELDSTGGRIVGHLPSARHDTGAAAIGRYAYVFGGGDGISQLDQIVRFDPVTGSASVVGRLPAASSDSSAAVIGGTAYVVGGYTGTQWLNTIVAYRPGAGARVVARLPFAVRYAAVASAGGQLVIAGGSLEDGSAGSAVFEFTPGKPAPVRIGTLPAGTTHATAAAIGSDRVRDRRSRRRAGLRDEPHRLGVDRLGQSRGGRRTPLAASPTLRASPSAVGFGLRAGAGQAGRSRRSVSSGRPPAPHDRSRRRRAPTSTATTGRTC